MPDRPLLIVWMTCDCMVWPVSFGDRVGYCGYCGQHPQGYVDEAPPTGKAMSLDLYRRRNEGAPNA